MKQKTGFKKDAFDINYLFLVDIWGTGYQKPSTLSLRLTSEVYILAYQ